ncbi:MAG: hypothetical protein ACRDH6_02380 [Actinomycetota bacterium]
MSGPGEFAPAGIGKTGRGGGGSVALEALFVVLVLVAGTVLAAMGLLGETDGKPASARVALDQPTRPVPAPAPSPTFFDFSQEVSFRNATSNANPDFFSCTAELIWTWQADPSTDPPYGEQALIRVTGPGVEGDYRRTLNRAKLELRLQVQLGTGDDRWTAQVISIGDREAFDPVPLEVTFGPGACL